MSDRRHSMARIARRASERNSSRCTQRNARHSISISSAVFVRSMDTSSRWRTCAVARVGVPTLIDVIFIYFLIFVVLCVCVRQACERCYDFWTLCVCRVSPRRTSQKTVLMCAAIYVHELDAWRALIAVSWTTIIQKKGRSRRPYLLGSRSARHTTHALFETDFPRTKTDDIAPVNDD